jgi:hypothetical protein
MRVKHEFLIHAICPFVCHKKAWDYYTVTIIVDRVVDVHLIENAIDECRGAFLSQEALCALIASKVSALGNCEIEMVGRHSANSVTSVEKRTNDRIALDSELLFWAKRALKFMHPVFPPMMDDEAKFKFDSRNTKGMLAGVLVSMGEAVEEES